MADSADYARRFGSLFLAGIFIFTSLAFTGILLWQSRSSQQDNSANDDIPEEVRQQLEAQQELNEEGDTMEGTALSNFSASSQPITELQSIDIKEGTGEVVGEGATITAHYTGALVSTGLIFQSSHDGGEPFTSPLSGLIQGWQKGIPGMKVGGTRRLIIPYAMAYGEAGSPPSIPARADLVFDIELVSVEQ